MPTTNVTYLAYVCIYVLFYLVVMCETLCVKWSQFVTFIKSRLILMEGSADTVEELQTASRGATFCGLKSN